MDEVSAGIGVAAVTFAGGLAGLVLHRLLPETISTGAIKDMTGAVSGLLTLLTALVLGLLIWTAYGVYAGQVTSVRTLATEYLQLDLALADYGPDAAAGRTQLKDGVRELVKQVWGSGDDKDFVVRNYSAALVDLRARQAYLRSLHPVSDVQKQALATANQAVNAMILTRLQMAVALTDSLSLPLVVVVVAWAVCIFAGFGLMHAKTIYALIVLALGALAVASAVYILIDLSNPYGGVIEVSPDPLTDILALMGK